MTDKMSGYFIYSSLVRSYYKFVQLFTSSSTDYNPDSVLLPIKEQEIIYGEKINGSFDQFIIPGCVIVISYSNY